MCLWIGVVIGYSIGLIAGVVLHCVLLLLKENDNANSKRKPF